MKNLMFLLCFLPACLFIPASCSKTSNNNATTATGGLGGSATIIARVDHYGALLDTAVVYIKYGTHDAPANGLYDDSLIVGTNAQAVFSNLKPGIYYLFAEGIHDPYDPATVEGGGPWTIANNTEVDTFNIGSAQAYFTFPPWWHTL